jgi:nucleoid DNA-binding protein
MYAELHLYFIEHRKLNLPGIGNFILERKPAEADFVNKCIHPPIYSVSLQQKEAKASHKFYTWIAATFGISENEAVIKFNDFLYDLKNKISSGTAVEWSGIGILKRGLGGNINFTGQTIESVEKAVPGQKIIRENAEHSVLVGERERTSVEMSEFLNQPDAKRSLWWVLPVAAALLAFVFIAWYFSENGTSVSSVSNSQKVNTPLADKSYNLIK